MCIGLRDLDYGAGCSIHEIDAQQCMANGNTRVSEFLFHQCDVTVSPSLFANGRRRWGDIIVASRADVIVAQQAKLGTVAKVAADAQDGKKWCRKGVEIHEARCE